MKKPSIIRRPRLKPGKPPKMSKKWIVSRATKRDEMRPLKGLSVKQQTVVAALVSGATDEEAGKVAGVGRQSISRWRHNDALFIKELNIATNRQSRLTMATCQKWMTRAMATAVNEVGKAIVRGDVATAKWLLERLGIDAFAGQTFQRAVDPVILPEDMGDVIDDMAAKRVDEYLTAKGVGPLERLRRREALTAKEAEALRAENDDEKG